MLPQGNVVVPYCTLTIYFLLEIILTIMCFYFLILIDLFCRLTILGGLTRGCIDVLQVKGLSGNRTTRVALTMAPFLSRICSGVWNSVGKMGVGGQGGLVQKRYLEQLIVIKKCRWMEATALPTVSQPLPIIFDPSNLNSWCFMILQIKFAFVDDIEINVNANLSKLQLTTAPSHHHQLLMSPHHPYW